MDRPWHDSYEPDIPHSLVYPDKPLFQFIDDSARRYPNNTAIHFYGKNTNYTTLDMQCNCFAHALAGLGVKRGDRVAIMLPNVPQCVIAYYGSLKLGAVVVMTNPLYVSREIQVQIADSGAETIITLDFFYPRIQTILEDTPLKNVILTSIQDALPRLLSLLYPIKAIRQGQWIKVEKTPPVYDMTHLMRKASSEDIGVEVKSDDPALLQYTGGTTGRPKGVMLSHRNLVVNTLQCRSWMPGLKEGGEVFLSVIPFFHGYGMSTCMNMGLSLGATLALLPRFVTKDVLTLIEKQRPTIFMGVQAMYLAINGAANIEHRDLSSINVCISGAGPLHAEVQREFETLTGGKLVEGYGLSEASPVTHANPINGKRKQGSIGLPIPDTDAKIVDIETATKTLGVGEVGELAVKGPQIMQGYWQNEEETSSVLREGWLYTGDMARMDDEGYFYIVDRKKDMIKAKGENVYPREIEEVLFKHPKIEEAVVAGLPDQFSGELIKAYVVLKQGESADEKEILEFCRQDLAAFKLPKQLEFRSELPKTIIGKVLRRVLIEEEMKTRETTAGKL